MDTLAKSPEAIPFDGRHHGNIQRFVRHGVPGGKLIITSALWLHWSQDYKTTGFILTSLSANRADSSSEMRIQLIFFPFLFARYWTGLVACEDLQDRTGKQKVQKEEKKSWESFKLTSYNLDELIRKKNTFMWYERHHLPVANWHTVINSFWSTNHFRTESFMWL